MGQGLGNLERMERPWWEMEMGERLWGAHKGPRGHEPEDPSYLVLQRCLLLSALSSDGSRLPGTCVRKDPETEWWEECQDRW